MQEGDLTVYTPNYKQKIGFFATWGIMIRNIIASKELIIQLFKRDFFMSYKKSFLGIFWLFISPAVGIVSWVFLNYAGVLQPGQLTIPFPVYILLSSSVWGLFMGFYGAASGTLGAGAGFITQINYPHEALLVKQTAQHLSGFLLTLVFNILVLLLFGVPLTWGILLLPFAAIPMFFLAAGMGLFISVVSVVASDISSIFNILLGFVYYATPIVYTPSQIDSEFIRTVISLNPLTYLVGGARDLFLYGYMQDFDKFLLVSIFSFFVFFFSWRLFFVSEGKVIERML